MRRTKGFKETVCSTCRFSDKKAKPKGSKCLVENARMDNGKCSGYMK